MYPVEGRGAGAGVAGGGRGGCGAVCSVLCAPSSRTLFLFSYLTDEMLRLTPISTPTHNTLGRFVTGSTSTVARRVSVAFRSARRRARARFVQKERSSERVSLRLFATRKAKHHWKNSWRLQVGAASTTSAENKKRPAKKIVLKRRAESEYNRAIAGLRQR